MLPPIKNLRRIRRLIVMTLLILSFYTPVASAQSQITQSFRELLERSEKDKKGLTFYVKGQTISGIVVKVIGTDAVEVRNQTFSRIIIRLDSIDALAIN